MKSILVVLTFILSCGLHAQDLVMKIINPQITGNQVTYEVRTENFTDLVAIQYSIAYDTNMLKFVAVQNINLQGMNEGSFYEPTPGTIINVWLDLNLVGATLDNGSLIYQLVFDMKHGTYGSVCFSQTPVVSEFVQLDTVLTSYIVVDDCHSDPFEVDLSSIEEIAKNLGLVVFNVAHEQKIAFSLSEQQALGFRVFDLGGKMISSFPSKVYMEGDHQLDISKSISPGIYLLTTEIQHQPLSFRILIK